jgi:small subunit ribosomal protein S14
MAKISIKNREKKRLKTVDKFASKRESLLVAMRNSLLTDDERNILRLKFQKLPRDSSPSRLRNRCALTGRPRGVFRKFGLCRSKLREVAMRGEVPGMTKASW